MSRNNDGLTLSQLGEINARLHSEVARLNEQVQALVALAEERREFIVNGVGLGYIQIPAIPFDKAIDTYERCLLKPKFAADAILNEVRAQAVKGFAAEMEEWGEHWEKNGVSDGSASRCFMVADDARKYAARIRAGEVRP